MEDKGKNTGKNNTHAMVLAVIGIVLLILGILIAGTIAIIVGIVLLVIAWLRASRKPLAK